MVALGVSERARPGSTKPRILGIANGAPRDSRTWSGSANALFSELERTGHLATAISAEPSRLTQKLTRAAAIHPSYEMWRGRFHASSLFARGLSWTAKRARESVREPYDAILQTGPYIAGTPGVPAFSYHDDDLFTAIGSDRMKLLTRHDVRIRAAYERPIYQSMSRIFTMSAWIADEMAKNYDMPRDQFQVVGAGSTIREELLEGDRDYGARHALFVGFAFERKGGPQLIEAFTRVRRNLPAATLTIVGGLPAGEVGPGIRSLGPIPRARAGGEETLARIFRSASLFVMPSTYEPFGLVFLEAMAAGLSCIGADHCAMPEIIADTGSVIPAGKVEPLARAIYDALSDTSHCARLGALARARYQASYGWIPAARRMTETIEAFASLPAAHG